MKTVTIELELTDDEAYHLALFLKRTHFGTFERHSDPCNREEPQKICDAVCATMRSLSKAGYAPR